MSVDKINEYLQGATEIIGERTPAEIQYDNAVVANLCAGMKIKKAIAAANREYPDEALQPEPEHWDDLDARYEYIRQHKIILRRLGMPENLARPFSGAYKRLTPANGSTEVSVKGWVTVGSMILIPSG